VHPSHFRLHWLLVSNSWTISGIVSFLFAFETRSSRVYYILSGWRVSPSGGTQSTSHRVGH